MKGTDHKKENAKKDLLEELFRNVSARERPSSEDEEVVRQALHAQWSRMTRRRKIRRAVIALASAASILLSVFIGLSLVQNPQSSSPPQQVATVERTSGSIHIHSDRGAGHGTLKAHETIYQGQTIVTGHGSRLALRWLGGESIRLDDNTELRLHSGSQIELVSGQIYVDTDAAGVDAKLLIKTPAGNVRHLGTRYLTDVNRNGTTVSVRDGRVQVEMADQQASASTGEQLKVDAGGTYQREAIPTYGPRWEWAESLTPAFSSDGRTLAEFMSWVAHETGRELEFASTQAEDLAVQTVLRGKVDMGPMQALNVMMQTSDLASEVQAGLIVIRLR